MNTANLCRCGHLKVVHRWNGGPIERAYCIGQFRINEAHPDYEPCGCTEYRPRPVPQGRML